MSKLEKIGWAILGAMYKAAKPPLDLRKFMAKIRRTGTCPKDWYMRHHLSEADYDRIKTEYQVRYKLTPYDMRQLAWLLLNYSPTAVGTIDDKPDRRQTEAKGER